jgi:cyanophycinase-like exopeptidase
VLKKYPQLLGIVLDEATALVVAGDECEVVGWGKVRFIASPDADAVELSSGARYDLAARRPK